MPPGRAPWDGVDAAPNGRGCPAATAAHGPEFTPQVQALREYRDGTLMATGPG